jgi:hypothetical protein
MSEMAWRVKMSINKGEALMWAARECPDRALEIGLILGAITRMAD